MNTDQTTPKEQSDLGQFCLQTALKKQSDLGQYCLRYRLPESIS